jgi:hypothetical protein
MLFNGRQSDLLGFSSEGRGFTNTVAKETFNQLTARLNKFLELRSKARSYPAIFNMCERFVTLGIAVWENAENTAGRILLPTDDYAPLSSANGLIELVRKLRPELLGMPSKSITPVKVPVIFYNAYNDATTKSTRDEIVAIKFLQVQRSAVSRGKEFSLTFADVRKLLKCKYCFYTGVELTDEFNADNRYIPTSRTFDRINNRLGYVPGNVVACTDFSNKLKNALLEQQTSPHLLDFKQLFKMVHTLDGLNFDNSELFTEPLIDPLTMEAKEIPLEI